MNNLKLLLLASYLNNLGWGLYAPFYALFVLQVGGDGVDVSLLWGVYALIAGLLMMFFGRLENSPLYNPTTMLIVGYALFVAVAAGYLIVDTVWQFYIVQIILAIAMGIMTPAAKATYMAAEDKGQEAGEWGLFDGGNYIVIAIAAFAGGILYSTGGFEFIFTAMILIQLFASLAAFMNWRKTTTAVDRATKAV